MDKKELKRLIYGITFVLCVNIFFAATVDNMIVWIANIMALGINVWTLVTFVKKYRSAAQ